MRVEKLRGYADSQSLGQRLQSLWSQMETIPWRSAQGTGETQGRTCDSLIETLKKRLTTEFHRLEKQRMIWIIWGIITISGNFDQKGAGLVWSDGLSKLAPVFCVLLEPAPPVHQQGLHTLLPRGSCSQHVFGRCISRVMPISTEDLGYHFTALPYKFSQDDLHNHLWMRKARTFISIL